MLTSYKDITDRLGQPRWWDIHGVPRYVEFHPRHCGVYIQFVALSRIACQACHTVFLVAVERDGTRHMPTNENPDHHVYLKDHGLPSKNNIGWFHYGDPPDHACMGVTMNSEPYEILQFWHRDAETRWEWVRDATLEFVIYDED